MSIWTHFTGAFGIAGIVYDKKEWDTVESEIEKIILPLPRGSEGAADHKIMLHDLNCIHFSDVLITADLRDVDSLDCLEKWIMDLDKKLEKKNWSIRDGCFYAYVEFQKPIIIYYDSYPEDAPGIWKKTNNFDGILLGNPLPEKADDK
jgi:hypothetical protein